MRTTRSAVGLDIGSNTISCCRITYSADQAPVISLDRTILVRLSEGLVPGEKLQERAVERALSALNRLYEEFEMSTSQVCAAATAVLRLTSHPKHFLEAARGILGVEVTVITGEEEAFLTRQGAIFDLNVPSDSLVLDIGGQSTELSWLGPTGEICWVSMPLGVVSLSERFGFSSIVSPAQVRQARQHIESVWKNAVSGCVEGKRLICVGGTVTTVFMLEKGLSLWRRAHIHGHEMPRVAVDTWLQALCGMSSEDRRVQFGMPPLRADVLPAGLLVLQAVMDKTGFSGMTVSTNGLRMGLALSAHEDWLTH